jgi:hypothetical protein
VRRRQRRRLAWTLSFLAAGGFVVAAGITDAAAHARDRAGQAQLVSAHAADQATNVHIGETAYARGLAGSQAIGLQREMASLQSQLATTQAADGQANISTYLQGIHIGNLQTCLIGVQGAYQQISNGNNDDAAADLSNVASYCEAAEGGSSAGLVYPFDFPDPFVLRLGSTYYAYATNSAGGNIQIITSTNKTQWSALGNALPSLPAWATPGGSWAPDVLPIDGQYVLYYSAVVTSGGEECISAATSRSPAGPFIDHSSAPLVCQPALAGSIDPSSFVAANGVPYLQWKSNGSGSHPATLWSEQLASTGTALAGPGASALLTADLGWEDGVVEAPDLIENAGRYFLFYSGNSWDSADYGVGVAACTGPLGPCSEPWTSPILSGDADIAGPGGESVFTDASGDAYMAFHAWLPSAVGYPHSRELYIRPLNLTGAEPVVEPAP